MSIDSDLSEKRLNANRKNAQSSTGPRTDAGKAMSSRNALTLGLFTKRDYVRRNEQTEYNELCARYVTELNPEGVLEETLVTAIVSATWRLRRCATLERKLVGTSRHEPMRGGYDRDIQNSIDRARSHSSLLLRRSIVELRHLQTERSIAKKFLPDEIGLPALASAQQIVTLIDRHRRAQAQLYQRKLASNCKNESVRPDPPNDRPQTPRNGRCPCGSGQKFKRCCLRGAQSVRPYPHDDPKKPKNPGPDAPPVPIDNSPVEKAA